MNDISIFAKAYIPVIGFVTLMAIANLATVTEVIALVKDALAF